MSAAVYALFVGLHWLWETVRRRGGGKWREAAWAGACSGGVGAVDRAEPGDAAVRAGGVGSTFAGCGA
jgi:hypothetical protein